MAEPDDINGTINTRTFFERVLHERDRFDAERDRRMEERWESQTKTAAALAERVETSAVALATKVEASALVLAAKVEASALALAESSTDTQKATNDRLSRLESFQNKVLGLAMVAPLVSAIVVGIIFKAA